MRLNKFLAQSGLGSRRAVEQLILAGTVSVNGAAVRALATQVDEENDQVVVGGQAVRPVRQFEYLLLNKPRGYDVTRGGRHHHRRAWDLLPKDTHNSVQSVGRLDRDSTGLLLFTNDGELAFRLAHPRYGCRKTYEVDVEGNLSLVAMARLSEGVELEDGPARAVQVEKLPGLVKGQGRLKIVMVEGRNRIVRRMCEALGHPVVALNRIAVAGLELGDLPRGKTRPLSKQEVRRLRQAVGLSEPEKPAAPRPTHPSQARPCHPPQPERQPRAHTKARPRDKTPAPPARRKRTPRT